MEAPASNENHSAMLRYRLSAPTIRLLRALCTKTTARTEPAFHDGLSSSGASAAKAPETATPSLRSVLTTGA
jgi:hypothetical protein